MRVVASTECIFCAIADGNEQASVVHSDELVVAFMDIRPAASGHLLVVPRQHAIGLGDLDPEHGAQVFRVAQRLAAAIPKASTVRLRGAGHDGPNIARPSFMVPLRDFLA